MFSYKLKKSFILLRGFGRIAVERNDLFYSCLACFYFITYGRMKTFVYFTSLAYLTLSLSSVRHCTWHRLHSHLSPSLPNQ